MTLMLVIGLSSNIALASDTSKDTTTTTDPAPVTTEAKEVEQVTNVIDILTFNDFHGNVEEKGKNIGMAKMVGYVNDQKAKNPNTLVVAAGDNYQGTALSNLTYGAPVTEMFKAMNLTASAVGNHEFDWGADRIAKWAEDGGFPYLAANIYEKATGEPVSWAKPYIIEEVNGKKIAFVGLSTIQTAYQTALENVKDLEFKTAAEGAKIWIDFLKAGKAEEGTPDVIIALTHVPSDQDRDTKVVEGNELDALTKVEGLDAVITGHSHRTVAGEMNGVPVVQAYKYGRSVGKISIELNEDKTVKAITPSVEAVYKISENIIPDEATKATYDKFEADFAPIKGEVAGQLDRVMSHDRSHANVTELGYWVSDIMRKATNTQIGLTNGGGLRRSLEAGTVTMGDLYEIMPYDNTLVTMTVTGEHLKRLVDHGIEADFMTDGQFAGLKVVYDKSKEYENRITSITLEDGTPIEMDKTYTLVTNDFIFGGGDKYDFKGATDVVDTFVPIRDAIKDAFKATDVVKVPEVNVIKGESETVYVIQVNDVLWKIAKKYNMTYQELAQYNEIKNPHLIYSGKELRIPTK